MEGAFRLHDLLLDFIAIKSQGEDSLIKEAVARQAKHLGDLAVLRYYSGIGEYKLEGLYSLIRLWRKLVDLSGSEQLEVDAYNTSLGELGEDASTGAANAHSAAGRLLELQVPSIHQRVPVCRRLLRSTRVFWDLHLGRGPSESGVFQQLW